MSRGPIPDRDRIRPRVPDMVERLRVFLTKPGHMVGGQLHIVTDDHNLADGHLQYVIDDVTCHCQKYDGQSDPEAVLIAMLMLRMTRTQRNKLISTVNRQPWRWNS